MGVGDRVRILPPFSSSYPGVRVIERIEITEDGITAYFVEGIAGAFDSCFLEVVNGS